MTAYMLELLIKVTNVLLNDVNKHLLDDPWFLWRTWGRYHAKKLHINIWAYWRDYWLRLPLDDTLWSIETLCWYSGRKRWTNQLSVSYYYYLIRLLIEIRSGLNWSSTKSNSPTQSMKRRAWNLYRLTLMIYFLRYKRKYPLFSICKGSQSTSRSLGWFLSRTIFITESIWEYNLMKTSKLMRNRNSLRHCKWEDFNLIKNRDNFISQWSEMLLV